MWKEMADCMFLVFRLVVSNPFGLGIPAMKDTWGGGDRERERSVYNYAMYEYEYITTTV